MKNPKNESNNFWSGYALGMLSGSLLIYAFATKKGRDTIVKIIEHTDIVENNFEDILDLIQKQFVSSHKKNL